MRNEAAEKRRSAVVALSRDVQVVMDVGRDVGAIAFPLFFGLVSRESLVDGWV